MRLEEMAKAASLSLEEVADGASYDLETEKREALEAAKELDKFLKEKRGLRYEYEASIKVLESTFTDVRYNYHNLFKGRILIKKKNQLTQDQLTKLEAIRYYALKEAFRGLMEDVINDMI